MRIFRKKPTESILYFLCLVFTASGAVNYGYSHFILALPFMVGLYKIGKLLNIQSYSIFIVACSIIVNLTIEYNPIIFPILFNGKVISNDTLYVQSANRLQTIPILPNTTLYIKGIKINRGIIDSDTTLEILTDKGWIDGYSYQYLHNKNLVFNKNIVNPFFDALSNLMYYPLLPIFFIK